MVLVAMKATQSPGTSEVDVQLLGAAVLNCWAVKFGVLPAPTIEANAAAPFALWISMLIVPVWSARTNQLLIVRLTGMCSQPLLPATITAPPLLKTNWASMAAAPI